MDKFNNYSEKNFMSELIRNNSVQKNKIRDLETIQKYIDAMNSNRPYTRGAYLNFDGFIDNSFDKSSILNLFNDGGCGMMVYGDPNFKQDYRITLKNSSNITKEHAYDFVKILIDEIQNRKIEVRMKNMWEYDAIILYISSKNLPKIVSLLEDLKDENEYGKSVSNATKEFGSIMPFSATVSDTPYYGITASHVLAVKPQDSQNGLLMSIGGVSNNGVIYTFNEYISKIMHDSYMQLLNRYNGDRLKITASKMYDSVIQIHKELQNVEQKVDMPLWMRKSNYTDFMAIKEKLNEEFEKDKKEEKQQNQRRTNTLFYTPNSEDLKTDKIGSNVPIDSSKLYISNNLKKDIKTEIEQMKIVKERLELIKTDNEYTKGI